MNLKQIILFIAIVLLAGAMLFLFSFNSDNPQSAGEEEEVHSSSLEDPYYQAFNRHYKIFSVPVPDHLDFAGEEVPLDRYDIYESLDRELLVNTYWHSNTQLMFKRAFRYFPVFDSILDANDVPRDFRYLAMIESSLANVVSPAGARGIWQIMRGTAAELGLEVSLEVDERYHLEKATEAACKYLKDSRRRFGSWTLAAAAYNMGNTATARVINDQKTNNYYDLLLNPETARYMFRILAVKTIYENPTRYGFYFREKDFYPPLKTYTVDVDSSGIDLVDFALDHDIPYKILRRLNPWLRSNKLTNAAGKTYSIKLPKENGLNYSVILEPYRNNHNIFNDTISVQQIH